MTDSNTARSPSAAQDGEGCLPAITSEVHELSITRFIHASPEAVYRAWTERLGEWWAPNPKPRPWSSSTCGPAGVA